MLHAEVSPVVGVDRDEQRVKDSLRVALQALEERRRRSVSRNADVPDQALRLRVQPRAVRPVAKVEECREHPDPFGLRIRTLEPLVDRIDLGRKLDRMHLEQVEVGATRIAPLPVAPHLRHRALQIVNGGRVLRPVRPVVRPRVAPPAAANTGLARDEDGPPSLLLVSCGARSKPQSAKRLAVVHLAHRIGIRSIEVVHARAVCLHDDVGRQDALAGPLQAPLAAEAQRRHLKAGLSEPPRHETSRRSPTRTRCQKAGPGDSSRSQKRPSSRLPHGSPAQLRHSTPRWRRRQCERPRQCRSIHEPLLSSCKTGSRVAETEGQVVGPAPCQPVPRAGRATCGGRPGPRSAPRRGADGQLSAPGVVARPLRLRPAHRSEDRGASRASPRSPLPRPCASGRRGTRRPA